MLDSLFNPKAVAVIGASTKELHIGNRIIKNLLDFAYQGPIYPINPKADEIRGVKCYASILEVPTDVDVVHMVIPAKFVPLAIDDCGQKGTKFVILNGGGFAEIGPKGAAIQEACLTAARKHGMRLFGPNCQGIINSDPAVRAYCNFTFTKPDPGHISIVSLSGGVAEMIHQAFVAKGIGTRMYASNGNACDITIPDILRYYGQDEGTRVIVLYVEGLRNPTAFLEAAREVAARKPILAMKAGRTQEGAQAAASHTGGLAKEDLATDLIFEKTGILSFHDEVELVQAAAAFASQPIPKGKRVGMITNTGGPAVIATDVLVGAGLEIPPLSEKGIETLKGVLHPAATFSNPIDVLAPAGGDQFRAALDVMMDEEQVDSVFVNFVTPFFVDTDSVAKQIVAVNKQKRKPIICNLMTDKGQWTETVRILKEGNVPCFDFPGEAARALGALVGYQQLGSRKLGQEKRFDDVDKDQAEQIVELAQAAGREFLSAAEVYQLLECYRIAVAGWGTAQDADEAAQAAAEIGYPVVIKADAQSIVHKSDVGGLAIDLANSDAVCSAVSEMQAKFDAPDLRFFVQKYIPGGREIILGAKAEEGLGRLLMFGLGGIYVEVLEDVVFKLTPVTEFEAREMLSSIKAAPLLEGVRGEKGLDQEAIVETIQRLSQLLTDLPMIQEMDLNPIVAFEDAIFAVDARVAIASTNA